MPRPKSWTTATSTAREAINTELHRHSSNAQKAAPDYRSGLFCNSQKLPPHTAFFLTLGCLSYSLWRRSIQAP